MPVSFPATRWSLIARLPGQPQQVGVLLALYADTVGAWLELKLRGERPERIQDIVQEVLLDLLAKPDLLAQARPGAGSRFRYYLLGLAWNAARNALRRERRHALAPLVEDAAVDEAAEHGEMDRAWALGVVQQAFEEVAAWAAGAGGDAQAGSLLRATLVEGLSLRQAASAAGIPLASASRRLAVARQRLQAAISERLRLSGDLGPDEDATAACAVLLERLRA